MKIPKTTTKPRFYVAIKGGKALSSWATLEDAYACVTRFLYESSRNPYHHEKTLKALTGTVIEVGPTGHVSHSIPNWE